MHSPPRAIMYKLGMIWNGGFTQCTPIINRCSIVFGNLEFPHEGIDSFKIMDQVSIQGGVMGRKIVSNCTLVREHQYNTRRKALFPCVFWEEFDKIRRSSTRKNVDLR